MIIFFKFNTTIDTEKLNTSGLRKLRGLWEDFDWSPTSNR